MGGWILVHKLTTPFREDPQGKFKPNNEGSYIVTKVLSVGALYLSEIVENSLPEFVTPDSVRKYFV